MVNSVILENIESLKKAVKGKVYYRDLNYSGLKNGSITVLNQDVTIQEVKIWLQSGRFDFHRRPDHGGFFEREVIKQPFKQSSCDGIKAKLILELNDKFPYISVDDCEVSCNFNEHRWEVKLAITDTRTGLSSSMFDSGQTITWDV